MRKWSVSELEAIQIDLSFIDDISDEWDCLWLASRIFVREENRTFGAGQCDACGIEGNHLMRVVDEYHDLLGSPSTLAVVYLCSMDR